MVILYVLLGILAAMLLYVVFLAVCSLCVDAKKEYVKDSHFYRALLYGASAAALKILRIRIHTSGVEKIPKDRKLLFVGNHRSNFDPIIQWLVLKQWNIAFISKEENFRIPFFGRIIRRCCFMAIDRENPRNALGTINRASNLLRSGEVSIGVYPEGTRSKTGVLLPFHDGVFIIARKADVPIVVATIDGTEKITHNYPWKRTHIRLDIVGVIDRDFVNTHRTAAVGAAVREMMENNLKGTE